MAYEFSREHRTVWWPCVVSVPMDDGEVAEHEFDILFELPKRTEMRSGKLATQDCIKGWRKIKENGKDVPFSPENLDALMEDKWFQRAVSEGFIQAASGYRAKN